MHSLSEPSRRNTEALKKLNLHFPRLFHFTQIPNQLFTGKFTARLLPHLFFYINNYPQVEHLFISLSTRTLITSSVRQNRHFIALICVIYSGTLAISGARRRNCNGGRYSCGCQRLLD